MTVEVPRAAIDRYAALRACPLLREFTEVGVRVLAEAVEQRFVGRETYAFRAGEASAALAVIAKGTLQLVAREGGAPLGEVRAGDTVGGFSLLIGGEHLLSALASTDVELLEISKETFARLEKSHPRTTLKLTLALAQDLAERLREAKGALREFLVWQISKRQAEGR
jgi:CRP-like cAMP-binding protein